MKTCWESLQSWKIEGVLKASFFTILADLESIVLVFSALISKFRQVLHFNLFAYTLLTIAAVITKGKASYSEAEPN